MTCAHWHVIDRWDGWCNRFQKYKYDSGTCDKHVPVKIEPIDKLTDQTKDKLTDQTKDKLKNPPQPVDKEEYFS